MQTYLVVGKEMVSPKGVHRQPSSRSSLAAVVYGMVRARRRHTTTKQGNHYCDFETNVPFHMEGSIRTMQGPFRVRTITCLGVLTSASAVQQLHRTSTRRAAAATSSSSTTSTAQGALDRLKAFSSIRRQPTSVHRTPSVGINQNGGIAGNPNNILQHCVSSPPKLRQQDFDHPPAQHRPVTASSRHPLQMSRSYHDMPQCYTVEEHADDDDKEGSIYDNEQAGGN